jgi:regulatory ArsR family protein
LCDLWHEHHGKFPQSSTERSAARQPPPRVASLDPECVIALKALGEDTRVRIVGLLIDAPLDVSEISKRVGASHYNVSKHLRILREAGLLQVEKTGRRIDDGSSSAPPLGPRADPRLNAPR